MYTDILQEKFKGRENLEDTAVDGKQRLYLAYRNGICEHLFDRIYKHSEKSSRFIKVGDFLEQLNYSILDLLQYLHPSNMQVRYVTTMSHRNIVYHFIPYSLSV